MENLDLIAIDKVLQLLLLEEEFLTVGPGLAIRIIQNSLDVTLIHTSDSLEYGLDMSVVRYYSSLGVFSERLAFWVQTVHDTISVKVEFLRFAFRREFKFTIESLNESSTL